MPSSLRKGVRDDERKDSLHHKLHAKCRYIWYTRRREEGIQVHMLYMLIHSFYGSIRLVAVTCPLVSDSC